MSSLATVCEFNGSPLPVVWTTKSLLGLLEFIKEIHQDTADDNGHSTPMDVWPRGKKIIFTQKSLMHEAMMKFCVMHIKKLH